MLVAVSAAALVYGPARVSNGRRKLPDPSTGLVFGPDVVQNGRRHLTASPALSDGAPPARFKMIGFDALTEGYEVWIALRTPNITPPSGHALSDIAYVPLETEEA